MVFALFPAPSRSSIPLKTALLISLQLKSGKTLEAVSATGAAISITEEIADLAFSPSLSNSLDSSSTSTDVLLDFVSSFPTIDFFSVAGVVVAGAGFFFPLGSVVKPAPPRIDQWSTPSNTPRLEVTQGY